MRIYKTTKKHRDTNNRLRWEKIRLTRTQRADLTLSERKELYKNRRNPCICAHCAH